MKNTVKRIFVEKKPGFDVEAQNILEDLRESLNIVNLEGLRLVNRYDIEGISEEEYIKSKHTIFSETTVDIVYEEEIKVNEKDKIFAVEYLPGQYDQRADSASQCVQILTQSEKPNILSAKVYIVKGNISEEEFNKIKKYCINNVDSREASLEKPETLEMEVMVPDSVEILAGFTDMNDEQVKSFVEEKGLAMSFEDLKFCQKYFRDSEKRNPTITEIKVIDTYWSDHCRHTTFMTELTKVDIEEAHLTTPIKNVYEESLIAEMQESSGVMLLTSTLPEPGSPENDS